MPSMKDIDERKARLLAMMEQLKNEEDMTRFLTLAQEIEKVGQELQTVISAFDAEMKQKERRARGQVEVVLTPEQRARVHRETGVSMTTVLLADSGGEINASMPTRRPEQIETEAIRQARAQKASREAREGARMQLERQLRDLESQGELMAERVAEMRERPDIKAILYPKD
jgi:ABC-type ATPase with predicted acetyltransferase domain